MGKHDTQSKLKCFAFDQWTAAWKVVSTVVQGNRHIAYNQSLNGDYRVFIQDVSHTPGNMKCFVLSLLLIQATIHYVASRKHILEDRYLSEKVCQDVDHLEVLIGGSGVACGGEMSYQMLSSFADNPSFRYKKAVEDKLYIIMIVDADEPGCKTKLHYMISNVPGKKLALGDDSDKDVISVYFPPYLPQRSTAHRFFIYAFSQTIPLADLAIVSARCTFDLNRFLDDDSLKLVAANMFKTQNK